MYDGTAKAEAEFDLVKDMLKNYQPQADKPTVLALPCYTVRYTSKNAGQVDFTSRFHGV